MWSILKQTCSASLKLSAAVCLSMYDLFVDTRPSMVKYYADQRHLHESLLAVAAKNLSCIIAEKKCNKTIKTVKHYFRWEIMATSTCEIYRSFLWNWYVVLIVF